MYIEKKSNTYNPKYLQKNLKKICLKIGIPVEYFS
jgi:hypothetical protein